MRGRVRSLGVLAILMWPPKARSEHFPAAPAGPSDVCQRALAGGPGSLRDLKPLPVCLAPGALGSGWDQGGGPQD